MTDVSSNGESVTDLSDFTPIQRRMLLVLGDGQPHSPEELHACLNDDQGAKSNIAAHLSNMRKKLRPRGEDIICEFFRKRFRYRHVRLLGNPYRG